MNRIGHFVFILLCCMVLFPDRLRAAMRTFEYTGTVQNVPSDPTSIPAGIKSGDPFVGYISYEDSVAPAFTGSGEAGYRGVALDMAMTVTIDNTYTYAISTPSSGDEIDIDGTNFELFKRGPTVYPDFAPNAPFSHLDFEAITQSTDLSVATLTGPKLFGANGLSDQQTSGAPYYYLQLDPATVTPVPEPAGCAALIFPATMFLSSRRRQRRND